MDHVFVAVHKKRVDFSTSDGLNGSDPVLAGETPEEVRDRIIGRLSNTRSVEVRDDRMAESEGGAMPKVELSLADKMTRAYNLAFDLWKLDEAKEYKAVRQGTEAELVYGWVDGLVYKYYDKMTSGQCSPQAMVDFDIEKFEESVDRDIVKMQKIMERLRG